MAKVIYLLLLLFLMPTHVLAQPTIYDTYFSWHDYEGQDWMSPVKDQGSCPSCWAFAVTGTMEAAINIGSGNPDLDMDLSEQELLSCALGFCEGWYPEAILSYASDNGITLEDCFPYQASAVECSRRCDSYQHGSVYVSDWGWELEIADREMAIKERILYSPVIATMLFYEDFYLYRDGVYVNAPSLDPIGGHVVVIAGWNDTNNSWICKNSWGKEWGMKGYFEIERGAALIGLDIVWLNVQNFTLQPMGGCSCSFVY